MAKQNYTHWNVVHNDNGIAWLHLDVQDSTANILSTAVLNELNAILDEFNATMPAGVAFVSDKAGGFIAGADVKEFTTFADREDALVFIRRGQDIMDRIEELPCPTVAVINGFCMGGGTELALACDYRVALDSPKTRIALPEIRLGIHPGFGGSVRAIRLLGPIAAMDMMLTGRGLDARRARKIKLVDYVVAERYLKTAAADVLGTRRTPKRAGGTAKLLNHKLLRPLLAMQLRKQVSKKARQEHYPAPYALIDLWQKHADDERMMLKMEANSVADLSISDTARNLVRVFLLQDRLKSLGDKSRIDPKHVHVIGAGVMGGDIAIWCALQGFRVTVQDTNAHSLAATMQRAAKLFKKRLKVNTLITAAMDRLIADSKGLGLQQADVIIEAIFEDAEVKKKLYSEIEPKIKPEALVATNTSSIPIETLAEAFSDKGRLIGLHFFNPVAMMPLVEVVIGKTTQQDSIDKALAFTRHIDKLPLPVKSSPGFLVNRILMPYMLEAMIMESEGIPKAAIDKAALSFGMPMGPIELGDTVGLDVGLFVGDILAKAYNLEVPDKLRTMVAAGKLGKKSGSGFYEWKKGKPVRNRKEKYEGDLQLLQDRMTLRMVNEAVACLRDKVVDDEELVDAGVIFGTGFAPFRGGPLHYLNDRGRDETKNTLEQLQDRYGERFSADSGW